MVGLDNRKSTVVLAGPPNDPGRDAEVVERVLGSRSVRVVCGGTTSKIVSSHINKPVTVDLSTATRAVPPVASIEGFDLVTEGIVTLTCVRDILARSADGGEIELGEDAASSLVELLLSADEVHFIVGTARNPAQPVFEDREIVVREIASLLAHRGKPTYVESV